MRNTTLVMADDHPIVLQGLVSVVENLDYNVLAKFKDGIACLNYILTHQPHIAILDINMPSLSGIEIVEKAKKEGVETKFVLLTLHKEESVYNQAMEAGANGYLLKENALEELQMCLREVMKGKQYFSQGLLDSLINKGKVDTHILSRFTKTEQKIIKLIAQNKKSKEIAKILFLSKKTIDNQRNNINNKLGLNVSNLKLADWVKENLVAILKTN